MEEKLEQFKNYLLNEVNSEYNLIEEQRAYIEVLEKFEEIFNL
jgi:hypothetical protein